MTATDWAAAAAFVAKHAPGLGNPLAMPIDWFSEVITALSDMLRSEHGDGGRSAVDREMRRLLEQRS